MLERILENKKTTITGIVVFATGAVLVGFEKASLTEFSAFLIAAIGLLFTKDPKIKS